jgi:2-haloacid dehalogenase
LIAVHPKAVVFDVGRVLYDWDPRFLYEKLIADPDQLDWFLDNVVTLDWHFQHDAGRPVAETSAELTAQYPEHADLIAAYAPRWLETIPGPVPGMLALVDELAARDVPLFAITNFSAEFWPPFRATAPVFDHFRDVIVSGEERLTKPDPAIYALALRRFGLAPGEGLFVDDRADNVHAGEAAGLVGHLFDGEAGLRVRLKQLGLLV